MSQGSGTWGGETGGHFVLHFCSSLVSLLSLGVNLLGHNGNSQDGRMKVLIPAASVCISLSTFSRLAATRREAPVGLLPAARSG